MQSLKDYLTSTQQYEGILDPNQDQVMSRMTDDTIRSCIREYCTYDSRKYKQGKLWSVTSDNLKITRIDKDNRGWYIETKAKYSVTILCSATARSLYDFLISDGCKMDAQKGFLIEDAGIYFRWRKHEGELYVNCTPNFESTDGLPEELDGLDLLWSCENSKKLDVRNKIKFITLITTIDTKISGNGCKNVIIRPDYPNDNITAPNGIKIHRPKTHMEYLNLIDKLSKH